MSCRMLFHKPLMSRQDMGASDDSVNWVFKVFSFLESAAAAKHQHQLHQNDGFSGAARRKASSPGDVGCVRQTVFLVSASLEILAGMLMYILYWIFKAACRGTFGSCLCISGLCCPEIRRICRRGKKRRHGNHRHGTQAVVQDSPDAPMEASELPGQAVQLQGRVCNEDDKFDGDDDDGGGSGGGSSSLLGHDGPAGDDNERDDDELQEVVWAGEGGQASFGAGCAPEASDGVGSARMHMPQFRRLSRPARLAGTAIRRVLSGISKRCVIIYLCACASIVCHA